MLWEEFMQPLGISDTQLAAAIHVPLPLITALVQEQAAMTPSLAIRVAKFLGTSADFWLSLQLRWDLYHVQQTEHAELETIQPLVQAP
jgi:addiction module HigA family antidote